MITRPSIIRLFKGVGRGRTFRAAVILRGLQRGGSRSVGHGDPDRRVVTVSFSGDQGSELRMGDRTGDRRSGVGDTRVSRNAGERTDLHGGTGARLDRTALYLARHR